MSRPARRLARDAIVVALAVDMALVLYAIGARLAFPYQIEWMTGSVLDHVERVQRGLPVYTEPTASWIAYIYPPLYMWIVAGLGGSALAARLVSLASVLVQAECMRRIARDLGATRFWSLFGAGMLVACYRYVGWWYDLERSDNLAGAMVLVMAVTLLRARASWLFASAGVLGGLAILAKQQAGFYVAGAAFGLAVASRTDRGRARLVDAVVFAVPAGVVAVALSLWIDATNGGWFSYFALRMPRAHGITPALAIDVFPHDIGRGFGLYAATFVVIGLAVRALRAGGLDKRWAIFASMLGAGFAAAVSSRLHIGGWINVLQPWSAFACIGAVVVATRVSAAADAARPTDPVRARRVELGLAAVLVAQLAVWLFDPSEFTPRDGMRAATERFHASVAELETRGEVLLVGRGHVTRARHFQMSALADVAKMEGHSPPDVVLALRERRFAAVIDDVREPGMIRLPRWPPVMLEDFDDLRAPFLANYFVARQVPDDEAVLPMIAPGMPRFVLLPRARPLSEDDLADLAGRRVREAELAEYRASIVARGKTPWFSEADIERLADPSAPDPGGPPTP